MTALILVAAVAAALTFTLLARPLVSIPGGVAATVAWWVASSAAADLLLTLPAVFALAFGFCTAAYAVHDAWLVVEYERAEIAERQERERDEALDYLSRHALAVENVAEEVGR